MAKTTTTWSKSTPGPGRIKGIPNKNTALLRDFLGYVVEKDQEKFLSELASLKGDKYINAYLMMLEYCTPKLARIEVKAELEKRTVQVLEIDGEKIEI